MLALMRFFCLHSPHDAFYNRNNTRRVHINMIIDPREGNGNAKVRRARALLFPIPRVNNHVDMDTEDFIPFIT